MQKIPAKEVATDREVFGASDLDQSLKEIKGQKFMDYFNVKDFGAKGDGVTDDTEAIQSIINKEDNIYFSKGDYLTRSLTIPDNKTILFDNQAKLIANENTDLNFSGIGFITLENDIKIKNLEIEIPSGTEIGHCIRSDDSNNIILKNIKINSIDEQDNETGYHIALHFWDSSNIKINNAKIYNFTEGIRTQAGENFNFENIEISYFRTGIDFNGGNYFDIKNIYIHDSNYTINTNGWDGIYLGLDTIINNTPITNLNLKNARIFNSPEKGIYMSNGINCFFKDITIEKSGGAGFDIDGEENSQSKFIYADNIIIKESNLFNMYDSAMARVSRSENVFLNNWYIENNLNTPCKFGINFLGITNNIFLNNFKTKYFNIHFNFYNQFGGNENINLNNINIFSDELNSGTSGVGFYFVPKDNFIRKINLDNIIIDTINSGYKFVAPTTGSYGKIYIESTITNYNNRLLTEDDASLGNERIVNIKTDSFSGDRCAIGSKIFDITTNDIYYKTENPTRFGYFEEFINTVFAK
jgi:hypothetical protein